MKEEERAAPDALKVGDFVSWNSSGGRARGKIEKIERDGKFDIPDSSFSVTGTPDDPAALIRVYRNGEPTDTIVGHKFSTLTKISDIRVSESIADNEKHPVQTEEKSMENLDQRHILKVDENDDSVTIEFSKHPEDVEESEPSEIIDADSSYNEDEERVVDSEVVYRTVDLSRSYLDEESRRVVSSKPSEEPVERGFGMEVLSHQEGDIDMDFIASGRAPLLLDHDMSQQIGVIEEFKLDQAAKRTVAVVRFGRNGLADEVFKDVVDGIRQNISVGYKLTRWNVKDHLTKINLLTELLLLHWK